MTRNALRNVQRGAWIALQDPGLHAIGGRRDTGGPLDRVPHVEHVGEVWIAGTGHGGQDPLAVLRDHVQQQLLIRQLIFTSLETGKAVLVRTGTNAQPKRATTHAGVAFRPVWVRGGAPTWPPAKTARFPL
jgi:hypothetical protein